MNTPITDAVFGPQLRGYRAETCRRLERDRAALMDQLQCAEIMTRNLVNDATRNKRWHPEAAANLKQAAEQMQSALSAARANFP